MSRAWQRGVAYCAATNLDGTPCGNKVARGASGYIIHRVCAVHRRAAERKRRADEAAQAYRRVHGHYPGERP